MPSRKDSFGYGVTIPATSARVVDTGLEILGDPDPGELAFLHSVLAQTFLPYRDPKTRDYVRETVLTAPCSQPACPRLRLVQQRLRHCLSQRR